MAHQNSPTHTFVVHLSLFVFISITFFLSHTLILFSLSSRIWWCSSVSWSPGWSLTFPKRSWSNSNGRRSSWSTSSYRKRRKNSSSSRASSPRTPPSNREGVKCSARASPSRAATVLYPQVQRRGWLVTEEEKEQGRDVGPPASASSPGRFPSRPGMKMRIQDTRRCDMYTTHICRGVSAGPRGLENILLGWCGPWMSLPVSFVSWSCSAVI